MEKPPVFQMPTMDEVIEAVRKHRGELFGFLQADLLQYVPYEQAQDLINGTVAEADWVAKSQPFTREAILKELTEYMPFAWDKANNCRGLSAARSIEHFRAWCFLLGDRAVYDKLDEDYEFYGKPALRAVCERYGINWRLLDDGVWRNDESDDGIPPDKAGSIVFD